jgi:hypothetical protein
MRGAIERWRDETGDPYVLGLVRIALGVLLLGNALRAGRELVRGYFGDVFHWPLVPEAFVPSRSVYAVLVGLQIALALLVIVGKKARFALAASALTGAYVLACDRLGYHHNRYALFCYALLLSFAPCDRSFRPGAPVDRVGPLWAARLAALQVSIVYLASSGSKLFDPDWRGGTVILERLRLYGGQAVTAGVPARWMQGIAQPGPTSVLAKLAIATELFLAFGLWSRRTRVMALWMGVWFHLTIEITSRVEGFTWLTLAMYALFVTPDVHARRLSFDASRPAGRAGGWVVARLDWLARFRVEPAQGGQVPPHLIVVVDRDGKTATGVRALALVTRCTALLFPLWVPLAVVACFTHERATTPRE